MFRIFQIGVILFWLGSLAWLAKTMLTRDESGMTPVDPRRPLEAFFRWNSTSQLSLLGHGERIGQITVAGFDGEGYETDPDEAATRGFSLTGTLDRMVEDDRGQTVPTVGIFWRSLFEFDEEYRISLGRILVRVPANSLNVQMELDEGGGLEARVIMAGETLFSYRGSKNGGEMPAIPGVLPGSALAGGLIASMGDPTRWKWKVEAFRGRHRMAGRRFPVYLVKVSVEQRDEEIRIFFSESGEPLQIDTGLGYRALSEVLVPLEAFAKH